MDREIKFKAYLKEEDKIIDVEEIHFNTKEITYLKHDDNGYMSISERISFYEIELMQYTGSEDCIKRRIYSGHVLFNEYFEEYGQVVFKDSGFYFSTDTFRIELSECSEECEIVGNIYENPELLERIK